MTRTAAVLLATLLWLAGPTLVLAQEPPVRSERPAQPAPSAQTVSPSRVVVQDSSDARETRDQLHRLLRQYPPAVGEILQRDPSLLSRPEYLAPYPGLVAFLAQHPEVARNPSFFLGSYNFSERGPNDRAVEIFGDLLKGVVVGTVFVVVSSLLIWLIRLVIDHRRWLRLSHVQTEMHTKLMDRLTSNDDLLAYIQSPTGRRFLESAPITLDGESRPTGAPYGRILWSLQAGIVLVALGIGFWFVQNDVMPEIAEGFHILAVIAIALGAGFAASAFASYFISTRLGLLPSKPSVNA